MKIKLSQSSSLTIETTEGSDGLHRFALYNGATRVAFADPEMDRKYKPTGKYIINWGGSGNVTTEAALEFSKHLEKLVGMTRRAPKGEGSKK